MSDPAIGTTATSAQLQADIDAGLTGDKVRGFDPAAAPLGTDEEAGGTPPTPEMIATARAAERRGAPPATDSSRTGPRDGGAAPDGHPRSGRTSMFVAALLAVAAALLLGAIYYVLADGVA